MTDTQDIPERLSNSETCYHVPSNQEGDKSETIPGLRLGTSTIAELRRNFS